MKLWEVFAEEVHGVADDDVTGVDGLAIEFCAAKDLGIGEMASEFNQQVDEGIALVSGKRPF